MAGCCLVGPCHAVRSCFKGVEAHVTPARRPSLAFRKQHRQQQRSRRCVSWPAQATARADRSLDYDSPQTSDDEATQHSDRADSNGDAAAAHASTRHGASGHFAAAPQHAAAEQNGHNATADVRAALQHSLNHQQSYQQQHVGEASRTEADGAAAAGQQIDAAELFPSSHVTRWTPLLVAYFPFGCVIGVVRMAMWVVLLAVDSELLTNNDTMIQVFYKFLGIKVRWQGEENLPKERHVIVSNHVSVGDLMVLYARPHSYIHLITSRLPRRITQAKHHRVKLRHASGETYCQLADSASADPSPVHLFPEGGMTNGRGMMKFSRGFMRFGRGLPIVPAAVRSAAVFGLSTHTLTSSFGANMFWFCFAPWVELDVTVLPPMRPAEGEGNGYFVDRVQRAIAAELGVPIADITLQQKHKLHR